MRIFSRVVMWLGVVVVLVAIGLAAKASLDIYGNMQPKNSVAAINPHPWIWTAVGGALVGGLLTGLGVGLSTKAKKDDPAAGPAAQPLPPNRQDVPATDREPTPPPAG